MVSVVILTLHEPAHLRLELARQTYQDFEVIIADELGIVNAMNSALKRAKGEILVRIDDDVALPRWWLENLVKPFDDPKVAGVTGPTLVPIPLRNNRDSIRFAERPGRILRWLYDDDPYRPAGIYKCGSVSYGSNFGERISRSLEFEPAHLEGTNWAMRTALIRKVGGFDPAFDGVAEWFDADVECKIKKLGYRLHYSGKASLWHLLRKGVHYKERFEGFGRIKNWLRFHIRHSKFHPKMIVFLIVWIGYFVWRNFANLKKSQ